MLDEPWAELADAIREIRVQLMRAMTEGDGEKLKFRSGTVELEFTVDIRKQVGGKTKVFVLPFGAEASADASTARVQRIKVTLQPVDAESGDDQLLNSPRTALPSRPAIREGGGPWT